MGGYRGVDEGGGWVGDRGRSESVDGEEDGDQRQSGELEFECRLVSEGGVRAAA